MTDDGETTIRRFHDIRDVIRAIAAASRLLDEQLELLEADVLDLMRCYPPAQEGSSQPDRDPVLDPGCQC
jgi:hypothetical protein